MGTVDQEQARVFQEEAVRVVEAGKQKGVTLRIIGALAFHNHCPEFGYFQEKLNRVYTDIDFAGYGKQSTPIRDLFTSIGYDEDLEINAFHAEGGRLIFNNPSIPLHVDVFMDKLDFCHPISWKGRLEVDDPTIPLAELLLEKMQIVKINEKDIIDTIMLLREHEVDANDEDRINSAQVAKLCAAEWGLWRTTTMNLDEGARLPPPPRPVGRGPRHRHATPRRAPHGHGRLPQGHEVEAPRQGRRQGQVVQERSTRQGSAAKVWEVRLPAHDLRTGDRTMAFWKKKDDAGVEADAGVLRHRHPRVRADLPQVPQRRQVLQGRPHHHGRRHHRQVPRADRPRTRQPLPGHAAGQHGVHRRRLGPAGREGAHRDPGLLPRDPRRRRAARHAGEPGRDRRPVPPARPRAPGALDRARRRAARRHAASSGT